MTDEKKTDEEQTPRVNVDKFTLYPGDLHLIKPGNKKPSDQELDAQLQALLSGDEKEGEEEDEAE